MLQRELYPRLMTRAQYKPVVDEMVRVTNRAVALSVSLPAANKMRKLAATWQVIWALEDDKKTMNALDLLHITVGFDSYNGGAFVV